MAAIVLQLAGALIMYQCSGMGSFEMTGQNTDRIPSNTLVRMGGVIWKNQIYTAAPYSSKCVVPWQLNQTNFQAKLTCKPITKTEDGIAMMECEGRMYGLPRGDYSFECVAPTGTKKGSRTIACNVIPNTVPRHPIDLLWRSWQWISDFTRRRSFKNIQQRETFDRL